MVRRIGVKAGLAGAVVLAALVGCGNGGSGSSGGRGGGAGGSGNGGSAGAGTGGSAGGGGSGGSVDAGTDVGSGPVPIDQYRTLANIAGCLGFVRCGEYPDQATCLANSTEAPHYFETLVADSLSGKIMYDPNQARVCIDFYANEVCTRTDSTATLQQQACATVFTGTVAVGGVCYLNEECADAGANCVTSYTPACANNGCCAGTCTAPPATVGAGSDCTSPSVACATGTTCMAAANGLTATCVTTGGVGQTCQGQLSCTYPLYCDPTSGTCKTPVGTGQPCNPALDSTDCDYQTDECESTTSVCTPLPKVGSPCAPKTGACIYYAQCDTTTNTCVELPGPGQACSLSDPACLLGTTCDATSLTCMIPVTAGACP